MSRLQNKGIFIQIDQRIQLISKKDNFVNFLDNKTNSFMDCENGMTRNTSLAPHTIRNVGCYPTTVTVKYL